MSNFAPCAIHYLQHRFPSVEHYYQSRKNDDPAWIDYCSNKELDPGKVKRASRKITLRDNWDDIKLDVMRFGVEKKFTDIYREQLRDTGNAYLIEGNYWGDAFWGYDIKRGIGHNHLGRLIMETRIKINSGEI